MNMIPNPPTLTAIRAAQERLAGRAVVTPLLRSPALDALVGGTVLLKPECLQRTGSFKFRGAYNRISLVPEEDRERGVVACSSGNHAQGLAEASRLLGLSATIVMPSDAPAIKRRRTEAMGGTVVSYDRHSEDREAIAEDIRSRTGGTLVHPYNDPGVIAGQGTVGAEAIEQARDMQLEPDAVLTCCGGGGLTAGIATAVKALAPDTEVVTVEPEGFDDHARSFVSGQRETNAALGGSICDALLAQTPGETTFAINSNLVRRGLAVSDQDTLRAVAFAFSELKLVVEPGGAVALAALLSGAYEAAGKTVVVVLSGGNIDPPILMKALNG